MIDRRNSTDERDPVEEVAAEFVERYRQGEAPSIDEYVRRHPEWSDEIRDLFPAIMAMEGLRAKKERRGSDGKATLGPDRIEQLGDFRLIREIGRGGMGIVYEAEQESLGRRVAVKILPRQMLLDHQQLERFKIEAQTAAKLHHTNIVPVFGVGEQDGFHYYVMQLIDGFGLDAVISSVASTQPLSAVQHRSAVTSDQREGDTENSKFNFNVAPPATLPNKIETTANNESRPSTSLTPHAIARIGLQVARGLEYAHDQGTLHRDIKPSNLILDATGHVWVADFGLAKALEEDPASRTDHVVGTLRYMAPEQLRGKSEPRSDVYSLGITLYEMLTQQPAFGTTDTATLLDRIHHGNLVPLRKALPKLPRNLETIVYKSLALEAKDRYASAGELADDLERYLSDRPIRARRASVIEHAWRWSWRNPALAAMSSLVLTLLIVIAVVSSTGYLRERVERNRAEVSSHRLSNTLDDVFDRFSPLKIGADGVEVIDASRREPVLSKEAAQLLQDLLPLYEQLAMQDADQPELRTKAARSQRRVGEIHERLGEYEEAIEAYQQAVQKYERLPSGTENVARELARVYNQIGVVYSLTSRADRARAEHERAIALLQGEASGQKSPSIRFEIARSYFLMAQHIRPGTGPFSLPPGRRAMNDGQRARGRQSSHETLQKAIDVLLSLRKEDDQNPAYRQLLANCYRELASDVVVQRDASDIEAEERAIALMNGLVDEFPSVSDYRFDLMRAFSEAQPVSGDWSQDEITAHIERLKLAIQQGETLIAERADVALYDSALTHVYYKMATAAEHASRGSSRDEDAELSSVAEIYYRKACNRLTFLVKRYPEATAYRVWLGKFQTDLAKFLLPRLRADESHVFVTRAIRNLDKIPEPLNDHVVVVELREDAYRHLHATLISRGDRELADLIELGNAFDRSRRGNEGPPWPPRTNNSGPPRRPRPPNR